MNVAVLTLTWWGSLVRVQSRLPVFARVLANTGDVALCIFTPQKAVPLRDSELRSAHKSAQSGGVFFPGFPWLCVIGKAGQVFRRKVGILQNHFMICPATELLEHIQRCAGHGVPCCPGVAQPVPSESFDSCPL